MAGAWALGTDKVAGHVKTINFARMVGAAMTGGMTGQPAVPRLRSNQIFPFAPPPPPQRTPEEIEAFKKNREQIAYAEGVVYLWETFMYWMVRFLVMVGIVSLLAGWARGLHLMAAVVILLSTAATLIGLNFLIDPEKGGLPRLSIWTHIIVAAIQSAYGVVLLIAFARKATGKPATVPQPGTQNQREVQI
jgi:hypothetical protein